MYLSKLDLNSRSARALNDVDDPYKMHCTLANAFGDELSDARLLFRVDRSENHNAYVIAQSKVKPDWSLLPDHYTMSEPSVTVPIWARNQEDETYWPLAERELVRFRLLCRPSRKPAGNFGLRTNGKRRSGPRVTTLSDEEVVDWLERKGGIHGFQVQTVQLTRISFVDSKIVQARKGEPELSADRRAMLQMKVIAATRFDGVLVVADPEKLREAVRNGIGPQKAYGFGLLSLAPLRT